MAGSSENSRIIDAGLIWAAQEKRRGKRKRKQDRNSQSLIHSFVFSSAIVLCHNSSQSVGGRGGRKHGKNVIFAGDSNGSGGIYSQLVGYGGQV